MFANSKHFSTDGWLNCWWIWILYGNSYRSAMTICLTLSHLIFTCFVTFLINFRGLLSKTLRFLSKFSGILTLTFGPTLPNMSSQTLPVLSNFWIKRLIVDTRGPLFLSVNSVTSFESQLGCCCLNNTFEQWIWAQERYIWTFSLKKKQQKPSQWDCAKKSTDALNLTAKFECDTPNSFRQIDISFQRVNYWSRYVCMAMLTV